MKFLLSLFAFVALMSCNAQKNTSPFSKIEYRAGACFGFCPVYSISINPDRSAVLEAEHFNFSEGKSREDFSKPREGTFKTVLKKEDYDALIQLLTALNAKSLQDYYGDKKLADAQTCYLTLLYADGSKKQIRDYGKSGTKELSNVYHFIDQLKKSQNWEKVE